MRKLVAALLIASSLGCATVKKAVVERRAKDDIVKTHAITQEMLDSAFAEAVKIGGGNPEWPCPVTLDRVVYVPATYQDMGGTLYGRTTTELMLIKGRVEIVETIEIHLNHNMACHIKQVLIHELLHTIVTRRMLVDPTFLEDAAKAGITSEEQWVRATYPLPMPLPLCGE